MKERVDEEIVRYLWWLRPILTEGEQPVARPVRRPKAPLILSGGASESAPAAFAGHAQTAAVASPRGQPPPRVGGDDAPIQTVRREEPKVGRNDPCPCGSGKKYKKCHGAQA